MFIGGGGERDECFIFFYLIDLFRFHVQNEGWGVSIGWQGGEYGAAGRCFGAGEGWQRQGSEFWAVMAASVRRRQVGEYQELVVAGEVSVGRQQGR